VSVIYDVSSDPISLTFIVSTRLTSQDAMLTRSSPYRIRGTNLIPQSSCIGRAIPNVWIAFWCKVSEHLKCA